MKRQFELELRELKSRILAMGGLVEQSLEKAIQTLQTRDLGLVTGLRALEKRINEEHVVIDNISLEVLARLSPVAADLRLILAIIKINTDLERIGDQALNIAYNLEHFVSDGNADEQEIDREVKNRIPAMASSVRAMVRNSLDAFLGGDLELAQKVLDSDDEVDQFKNQIYHSLVEFMKTHPKSIGSSLDLILIARNLERMGDHATNIAENVIFASTGDDVRHGLAKKKSE